MQDDLGSIQTTDIGPNEDYTQAETHPTLSQGPGDQGESGVIEGTGANNTGQTWQAAVYDFSKDPIVAASHQLDRTSGEGDLLRTARWCLDGSTILTTAEDRSVRLFPTTSLDEARLDLTLPQPAPILSSSWYPSACPSIPETFCFALGIRDTPVRLVDAHTGHVRATYPIVDHRERFVAPYSMAWNSTASKLYCGHENAVEVVDIAAPGYDTSERIKTSQTRGDKGGQKGIISALAFSTAQSGMFAAGCFSGSVSLYAEDTPGSVGHLDGVEGGGVTQLAFHPLSPSHLFVAARRSSHLQVYDLRNTSSAFHTFPRLAPTNQRLGFDLDPWGRWLAAGDAEGRVTIWDVGEKWGEQVWNGKVAQDAISSVQFHPLKPALLVSSGSRDDPYEGPGADLSNDEESGSDSSADSDGEESNSHMGVAGALTRTRSRSAQPEARPTVRQLRPDLQILSF